MGTYFTKTSKKTWVFLMGGVVKRVMVVEAALRSPEKHPEVGGFSGPCRRFLRSFNCFVAILVVLFGDVLPGGSV